MFGISFGEVFIIAVVGLVIIGPQRLPQTARFIGHLTSRVQRQITSVKTDIRREMELEDLKNIHREYEDVARDMRNNFDKQSKQWRDDATETENIMRAPLTDSSGSSSSSSDSATAQVQNIADVNNTDTANNETKNTDTPTEPKDTIAMTTSENDKTQTATIDNNDNVVNGDNQTDSAKDEFAKKQ